MPKFDGTGPSGQGPRSGRGMGSCGHRMRFCGRRRFSSPKNELAFLEEEEQTLEKELAIIKEEKAALEDQLK